MPQCRDKISEAGFIFHESTVPEPAYPFRSAQTTPAVTRIAVNTIDYPSAKTATTQPTPKPSDRVRESQEAITMRCDIGWAIIAYAPILLIMTFHSQFHVLGHV